MSDSKHKHDASDKKLQQAADAAKVAAESADAGHGDGPGHDAAKIARHDDLGQDRLFEHREQRDDAEKQSEKSRLSKETAKHE